MSDEQSPDLVTVLSARDATILPVLEGLLREAEIPYWSKREGLQDLFAWGRLGLGHNLIVGPVEILVHPDDADRARDLLAGFDEPGEATDIPEELS